MGLALSSIMQNAANVTLNEADVLPQDEAGFSALLRLRQGSSARATWVVEASPGGTMVSVGSDAACDWQVRAAFVPARAFSVLVVGGRTFVRSGPEPGVLLDGKPMVDGWVQVHNGARIDVGLARMEVTMGYGDWLAPGENTQAKRSPLLQTVPYELDDDEESGRETIHELNNRKPHAVVEPTAPRAATQAGAAQAARDGKAAAWRGQIADRRARQGNAPRRNATIELTLDDLDYMGTPVVNLPGVGAANDREVSGEYAVPDPTTRYSAAPSLLGRETPKDKSKLWRYAVAGVVTVSAYGGWVYLLDFL
jgi:hypothetical protein